MNYKLDIRRTDRRTMALEIKESGVLIVRVPRRARATDIEEFVRSHEKWIDEHMKLAAEREAGRKARSADLPAFTMEDIRAMADKALQIIPPKVQHYAGIIGVNYGRITIRNQVSRWGSCSAKGNLNFNCLLMQAPEEVLDYVIVHELCHRIEMNHSKRFWSLVESVMPDYRERKMWLDENGGALIDRMRCNR